MLRSEIKANPIVMASRIGATRNSGTLVEVTFVVEVMFVVEDTFAFPAFPSSVVVGMGSVSVEAVVEVPSSPPPLVLDVAQ